MLKLTTHEKLQEMDRQFAPFPNLSTLGSYSYFTQTIQINGYDSPAFDAAFNRGHPATRLALEPLALHEFQHFEDHLLSAWGAGNLRRLFTAMNGRVSGDRSRLGELTAVYREVRDLHLNDYYNELGDAAMEPWNGETWAYDFSTGVKLDAEGRERPDCPVLFARFADRKGRAVARVPVTVASLLEVRAMAVEIVKHILLIDELPADAQVIERSTYESKTVRDFYDPLLTPYSVIAHLYANTLGIKDIPRALTAAGRLAWAVLNLVDARFDAVRIPERYQIWGDRNAAALARRDRGYAYAMILENSRGASMANAGPDLTDWILQNAGLPPQNIIYDEARVARAASFADLSDGPYTARFRELSRFADRLGEPAAAIDGMVGSRRGILPLVLSGDDKWLQISTAGLSGTFADPRAWVDDAHVIHRRFDEFLNACVV